MHKLRRLLKDWAKALILSLIILAAFVILLGNWFVVTSTSMEKSLMMGDFVFVNKTAFGPRLPYTPISLPFSGAYSTLIDLGYHRLPGYQEVQRNHLVAFNYPDLDSLVPIDHKSVWIKRVVGLPGETISFEEGKVYINGERAEETDQLKFNYHIQLSTDENAFFMRYGIREASRLSTQNDWLISVTPEEAEEIKAYKGINFIRPQFRKNGVFDEEIYPYELSFGWNEDFYGPVLIPKKGLTLPLTISNIPIYRLCIEAFEGQELVQFGNQFYIEGKPVKSYTFKYNYYFVAGDNRHNSSDSRYWGFLPETHLIGKVSFVCFSIDKGANALLRKIRWDRFFNAAE